jgi:hypothetical protein
MVTDTTTDAQLRRTIQKKIENEMPLQLLKRIVYEVRCEEMGIRPDDWKLYPDKTDTIDPILMSDFYHYVLSFYGENGIYNMGATLDMVMEATKKYINSSDEFYGDSFDREAVRDILIDTYQLKFPV